MSNEIELFEWLKSQLLESFTDDLSTYLLFERHISYQRISCPNDSVYKMIRSQFRETPQISNECSLKLSGIISILLKDESKSLEFRLSLLHSARGADDERIYLAAIEFYFMVWSDLSSDKLMSVFYDLEKFDFPKTERKFDSIEHFSELHKAAYEKLQDNEFHQRNSFLANEFFESLIPVCEKV